ncbi:type III pantothenate kinase [Siphonobacter sp. BAB-5405]|uniref:type III pantothenate kinase n=1 Tax=Siphonobacter sp. BAB-5405 TaxID=1864825 RepID=UPI000C7FCB56|nr:type III pantothenate kinase [Siphonobacter sp. BAB-5405]PMD95033.1 type III pantothenate kinase [Siphonobacter sp. BAB-5405]
MFLAIDVGNTDIVFGIHSGSGWRCQFRIPTHYSTRSADYEVRVRTLFLENDLKISDITRVGISSVVPGETGLIRSLVTELFLLEPFVVGPEIYPMLGLGIASPREIGTDLVCNAVYAWETYRQNSVVVDFGTALTFTVVSEARIVGVNIVPGIKTALRSLFANTAQLPEVPLEMPASAIGKDTVHAIQAGILWGYVGLVKEQLFQIQKEVGPCKVLATGGLSSVLKPLHELFEEVDINLTLNGLKIIGDTLYN